MLAPARVGGGLRLRRVRLRAGAARARRARCARDVADRAPAAPRGARRRAARRRISTGCWSRACRTSATSPDSPGSSALLLVTRARRRCSSPISATRRRSRTKSAISRASSSSRRASGPGSGSTLAQMRGRRASSASSPRTSCTAISSDCSRAGARWQWRPTVDLVETLRERKDADEVALIASAAGDRDAALERTLPQVRAGHDRARGRRRAREGAARRRERGVSLSVDRRVRAARGAAARAARRRARSSRATFCCSISAPSVGGYCADITRTVVVGTASDRAARGLRRRAAGERARGRGACAPGCAGGMPTRSRGATLSGRGYGEAFGHSLGHGLGLEVHEAPRLARRRKGLLAEGAVVTIEPGIYGRGGEACGSRTTCTSAPAGRELLTDFTRELHRGRRERAARRVAPSRGHMIDLRYVKKLIEMLDGSIRRFDRDLVRQGDEDPDLEDARSSAARCRWPRRCRCRR